MDNFKVLAVGVGARQPSLLLENRMAIQPPEARCDMAMMYRAGFNLFTH